MRRVSSMLALAGFVCVAMCVMLVVAPRSAVAAGCPGGPTNTTPPSQVPASGTVAVGDVLSTPSPYGAWVQTHIPDCGDLQPTQRLAQWLRNGAQIPGASADHYTVTQADEGDTLRVRIEACSTGGYCTWALATGSVTVAYDADVEPVAPLAGELLRNPVDRFGGGGIDLTASGNPTCPVAFEVSNTPAVVTSGPSAGAFVTPVWTHTSTSTSDIFPSATDRRAYFWHARFSGGSGPCPATGPWSGTASFTLERQPLGVVADEPFLNAAGVSVNEASGNLVVAAPAPSYVSVSGSLSASVTYNSQDGAALPALGSGWSIAYGDSGASVPVRLIDHSVDTPTAVDAAEVVYDGASSRWFAHEYAANGLGRYDAPAGESAQLTKSQDPALTGPVKYTLSDNDGSVVTFVRSGTSNVWTVATAVLPVSKGSTASLTYTFDTTNPVPRILSISDSASGRTLTFTYPNSGFTGRCVDMSDPNPMLLCITGPDPAVAYRYESKSGWSTSHLYRVIRADALNSKERVLAEYGYDPLPSTGAGLLQSIRSANDVNSPNDPNTPRSTAFTWAATHQATVTYDAFARPIQISNGPVTTDSGTQTMTWTIGYSCGLSLTTPTWPHPTALGATRTLAGCTQVRAPNQQPSGALESVLYDQLSHPLEAIDELGRHTRTQYDATDAPIWSEDAYAYPTDYLYDPVTHVLDAVEAPGPDPANVQANRPTARFGYDEVVPDLDGYGGSGTSKPLQGVQAAFFANAALAGVPAAQRTEGTTTTTVIDKVWDATTLPTGMAGHDFSARFRGSVSVPALDTYHFRLSSDGSVQLWVDGQVVVDGWTTSSGTLTRQLTSVGLTLSTGPHTIMLEYAHSGAATAETHLLWQQGTGAFVAIPTVSAVPNWLNQTSVTTPGGLLTSTHYAEPWRGLADYTDVVSSDTSSSGVLNHYTTMHYDDFGRMVKKTLPNGNIPTGTPAAACTPDANTGVLGGTNCDAAEFTTTYTYWNPNDLTSNPAPTAPSGCTIPLGTIVDTTGQIRQTQQNATAATPPAPTKTWYDASGRPVLEQRGAGVWCMRYNDEGRLSIQYAPGEVTTGTSSAPQRRTFTYDPSGALRTVTGGDTNLLPVSPSTLTFEYDEAGRLRKSTGALTEQAQYGYDTDSNIVSRRAYHGTLPGSGSNYTTTYAYDAADQLTQQTDPAARVFQFGYDQRGQLVWTWYPNSTLSWNRVNPDGWTMDTYARPCPAPVGTCGALATAPVTPSDSPPGTATSDFADWNYSRNFDGNETQETRTGSGLTSTVNAYGYDTAGRLTSASNTIGAGTPTTRSWGYDLDSNRVSDTLGATTTAYGYASGSTAGWPDALFSTTSGATKTCYAYDTDGRQISRRTYSGTGACTSTVSRYSSWDGRNRNTGFSSVSAGGPNSGPIKYDPLDRNERFGGLASANDRWFEYAGMDTAPTFEKSVSSGAITRTHIPGPAGDLAEYAGDPTTANTVTYHYYNAHGDLAATTNQAGTRFNTYVNEPFGKPTQYETGTGKDEAIPSDTSLERYNGRWDKRYDSAWGIIEMGARPYDVATGKFLSPDPVDGGSANNYDYADQDPVNGYDLSGQAPGSPAMWAGGCKAQGCSPGSFSLRDALDLVMIATSLIPEGKEANLGVTELEEAAAVMGRGGELTAAGRALSKHGGRTDAFPKVNNIGLSANEINARAQTVVNDILRNIARTYRHNTKRYGAVIDVFDASGRGIRYGNDGRFIGFLERPR